MLAALASAALIVAGSLAVGHATLIVCGLRDGGWRAGPVGLALLLALGGVSASAGARATVIAIVLAIALILAFVVLVREARTLVRRVGIAAPAAAGLAGLMASIPFIAAGSVGILGVSLVNDDMASHLLMADWIDERFRPEPVFIDQGYPLGPHGVVAGLSDALAASPIDVFAGLVLAIPALTALVAYAALSGIAPPLRVIASALVALPYLATAYLAQEAFKEPILALFLLTFALLLPTIRAPREALPVGILAAGTIYVYSFPGLAWLVGTALVWGLLALWSANRKEEGPSPPLPILARGLAIAATAFALLVAPEIPRLLDFTDFRALDPDRANNGGAGNLGGQLSPLTALGIWPTSSFRLSPGEGAIPAAVFYLCGLAAAVAIALALPRWLRRHGAAIPAALITAVLLYLGARAFGTIYTSAKALAIAAPLIMLIALGGLLADRARALKAVGIVVGIAGAFSSFLVLRQAPVGPEDHMQELAKIRPLVAGSKLLFLGRDNFILYELRGSKPFVTVKNYYDPYYAQPNMELEGVFTKFDFDAVEAQTLKRFPYVLTTRAAYGSGPPPAYDAAVQTDNYVLWERGGRLRERVPAERDAAPGAEMHCRGADPPAGAAAALLTHPVEAPARRWSRSTLESGGTASLRLRVPSGRWALSLQYNATRPVSLGARVEGGAEVPVSELPGNLDFRGPGPYWPAGEVVVSGGRRAARSVQIVARVEDPPLAGRLLGADSVAHLGAFALTPVHNGYVKDVLEPPYPGAAAALRPTRKVCGLYLDWTIRPRGG